MAPSLVAHVLATGAVRSMPLSACLPNLPAVLDSIRPYQKQTPARERPRWVGHLQGCLPLLLALYIHQQQTALAQHVHAALQPDHSHTACPTVELWGVTHRDFNTHQSPHSSHVCQRRTLSSASPSHLNAQR